MKSLHLFTHLGFIEHLLYAVYCSYQDISTPCVMQSVQTGKMHFVFIILSSKDDGARGIKESLSLR